MPILDVQNLRVRFETHHGVVRAVDGVSFSLEEGETLYVLETHPAGYALIATNEAEKAANINVLEFRAFGAFGRVYLGGYEADIEEAARAAQDVLGQIDGRDNPGPGAVFY